ncbi:MAG: hypothetical protein R2849_14985 [Thermomicrobiales bacterium]
MPGVEAVRADVPTLWGTGIVVNGQKHEVVMYGMVDLPEINRPLLTDGRWLDPGDQRGIITLPLIREGSEIDVGDSVGVAAGRHPVEQFGSLDFAINVNRSPYPNWDVSSTWVLPEAFVRDDPAAEKHPPVDLRASDRSQRSDRCVHQPGLRRRSGSQLNATADIRIEARDSVNEWNQLITIFLGVFGLFAFAAVRFVIAT